MKFHLAAVFSPIVGALARAPAEAEQEPLHEAEHQLTTGNIVQDVVHVNGNNSLHLATISDCDTISGPKPQVCMGATVFALSCASCHTGRGVELAKTQNHNQLEKYLESPHGPAKNLKGTEVFEGIKKSQDRLDLVAYLKAL